MLHVKVSSVYQQVTMEMLRQVYHRYGAWYMLCAYEMVIEARYCVEVYVQFHCRWDAARAREALDGRALYDGCCFLKLEHVPPIYTKITTPDDEEWVPEYFYDDTPYDEWTASLAAAEYHDEAPTPSEELEVIPETVVTAAAPCEDIDLAVKPSDKCSMTGGESDDGPIHDGEAPLSSQDVLQILSATGGSHTRSHTMYSTECPSRDGTTSASAFTSATTHTSPTTSVNIFPELATPVVSDKALDVDVTSAIAPTPATYSTGGLGTCSTVDGTLDIKCTCSTMELRPLPWPSFECSPVWTSLVR